MVILMHGGGWVVWWTLPHMVLGIWPDVGYQHHIMEDDEVSHVSQMGREPSKVTKSY